MKHINKINLSSIFLIQIFSSYQVLGVDRQFGKTNEKTIGCGTQRVQCHTSECNSNSNARIIGGSKTFPGEYPWLVLLRMSNSRSQFCSGTLLDSEHILTANHCVFDFDAMKIARLRVILGDYHIRTTLDGRHEERRVSKIFSHPKWSIKSNENDIAILKLRRPVNFTDYIHPICLEGELPQENYEGEKILATIVGYGRTTPENKHKSTVPIKAVVPLRNHQECQKLYLPFLVSKNMICAGGDGKDACVGDSGGPLMLQNRESQRWEQIGIISWGNSCEKLPGVYTRIENYMEFIRSTLKASTASNEFLLR